ncbi:RagB/SusD family nutrient uptake outer membrane protein, partial [uncultured Bacteroides sp.]
MKRYVYIITACILCLSSCKGFLEENPKDAINENQIAGNLKELYMHSVATLYNNIGGYNDSEGIQGTGRGIYDLNTFTTDEAIMPTRGADWYDGGFWQGLYLHDWGTNNNSILATWEYLYKSVMLCNESARRIKDYATEHSDDDAQPLMSEVRALRALFYYHLMDLFGRVPLIRETEVEKSVKEQAE